MHDVHDLCNLFLACVQVAGVVLPAAIVCGSLGSRIDGGNGTEKAEKGTAADVADRWE